MRSYKMKKSNRLLSGLIMICLSVVLIGVNGVSFVNAAGYDDPVSIQVPYELTYEAGKNRTNDSFDFQIKPIDGAPMPAGSGNAYNFSIAAKPGSTVSGNLNLNIVFPGPGEYDYNVSAYVPKQVDGFNYDMTAYTLKLYVKNSASGGLALDTMMTALGSDKKKVDALVFKPSHEAEVIQPERARPTTTPDGNGTVPARGITADGQPAPEVPEAEEPEAEPEEPTTVEKIVDNVVPKPDPERDYWALVNVLAALASLVTSAVMAKRYFERIDTEEDEYIIRREGGLRLAGLVPAAASIVTVLLTENFSDPMGLVDEWTWLSLALLAVEAVIAFAAYRKYDKSDDNSDGQGKSGQMKEGLA